MVKVKNSHKLNKLFDQIVEYQTDCDVIGLINPDCFAIEHASKYRSDHFAEFIEDGLKLANKSIRYKKPIYSAYDYDGTMICYFVGDLSSLIPRLEKVLACLRNRHADLEKEKIANLEKELKKLKSKK